MRIQRNQLLSSAACLMALALCGCSENVISSEHYNDDSDEGYYEYYDFSYADEHIFGTAQKYITIAQDVSSTIGDLTGFKFPRRYNNRYSSWYAVAIKDEPEFEYIYDTKTDGIMITGCTINNYFINIPNSIDDTPVTAVDCDFGNDVINIVFPETVKAISLTTIPSSIEKFNVPRDITHRIRVTDDNGTDIVVEYLKDICYNETTEITRSITPDIKSANNNVCVHMENNVTSIGNKAFEGCDYIKSVELSSKLASVGDEAFANCTSLKDIYLYETISSIGDYAFANCTSLGSIGIPRSVTHLGEGILEQCSSDITVYYRQYMLTLEEFNELT